jgi:uncharacterized protein (TIGR03067 family)
MKLVVAFVLISFTAAPVPKADPLQETKQNFQGEWKFVDIIRDGRPEDQESIAKATFVIKGDKMEVTLRGHNETLTFTLDPKTDPPSIDTGFERQ